LDKLHAPPRPDIPIITVDDLKEADGFLFGKIINTRKIVLPSLLTIRD
jgi:NAD(P)H dehydrogenase (quinone)